MIQGRSPKPDHDIAGSGVRSGDRINNEFLDSLKNGGFHR